MFAALPQRGSQLSAVTPRFVLLVLQPSLWGSTVLWWILFLGNFPCEGFRFYFALSATFLQPVRHFFQCSLGCGAVVSSRLCQVELSSCFQYCEIHLTVVSLRVCLWGHWTSSSSQILSIWFEEEPPQDMAAQHLKPMSESGHSAFVRRREWFCGAPRNVDALGMGRMTALQMDDEGVRGIVVGNFFRRVVVHLCQAIQHARRGSQGSVRAGCDCVAHLIRGARCQ